MLTIYNCAGSTIWDAEIVLAHFVEADNIQGSVMELGCGTALAAMVCGRLGCRIAVQELPDVLPRSSELLASNGIFFVGFEGRWGPTFVDAIKEANESHNFDNVIMADVLYYCEDFNDLLESILICSKPATATTSPVPASGTSTGLLISNP